MGPFQDGWLLGQAVTSAIKGTDRLYATGAHAVACLRPGENGGLIFPDTSLPNDYVVRIDHDQALQSTSNVQYQPRKNGPWVAFTWRFDSGIVASAIPDLASALVLTWGPAGPNRLLLRQPGGHCLRSDHHLQCPLSELGSQIGQRKPNWSKNSSSTPFKSEASNFASRSSPLQKGRARWPVSAMATRHSSV